MRTAGAGNRYGWLFALLSAAGLALVFVFRPRVLAWRHVFLPALLAWLAVDQLLAWVMVGRPARTRLWLLRLRAVAGVLFGAAGVAAGWAAVASGDWRWLGVGGAVGSGLIGLWGLLTLATARLVRRRVPADPAGD